VTAKSVWSDEIQAGDSDENPAELEGPRGQVERLTRRRREERGKVWRSQMERRCRRCVGQKRRMGDEPAKGILRQGIRSRDSQSTKTDNTDLLSWTSTIPDQRRVCS